MTVAGVETLSVPAAGSNGCLYVALSKEHRVSRTLRAAWYLAHLNQPIISPSTLQESGTSTSSDDQSHDMHVLGVRGVSGGVITTQMDVLFVSWQYSLVFVLDLSPTMRGVSNYNYAVKVDEAVLALLACLTLLTQPFTVEEGGEEVEPRLWITVFAHSGVAAAKPVHVLVQGLYVTQGNCTDLVNSLRQEIRSYENILANADLGHTSSLQESALSAGAGVEAMLRVGTLALQLLPRHALKGIILLTDGLTGFSSPASMHSTVNNMRGSNTSCWVLHAGGEGHPSDPLGLVADLETLNFVCRACNGCVMQPDKIQSCLEGLEKQRAGVSGGGEDGEDGGWSVRGPNEVQEAVLMWSCQASAFTARVRGVVHSDWVESEDPFMPHKHKHFNNNTITAPLLCVVGCKIREGFFMKEVQIRDSVLEVQLCYPWKPNVNIYYTISASWPLLSGKAELWPLLSGKAELLQLSTSYDGPYSFVHDVYSDPTSAMFTTCRLSAVRKFKQALQRFSSSDALLAHFLSFSSSPSLHALPHSVQDGLPLFHFLPNSSKPVPSLDISTSKGKPSLLHQFWRPLCTIDTSQWYRWFHNDKLVLILHPEHPLPCNLHQMANGRYGSPLCRPAASHLFDFLKGWSSMVLLEGHLYIRFVFGEGQPRYFCLVRVAQKSPCVVLHVGHIVGMPHHLQLETTAFLSHSLGQLCAVVVERGGVASKGVASKKQHLAARGKPILTVIGKQLQKFMVRYEQDGHTHTQPGGMHTLPRGMQFVEAVERMVQMDYLPCSTSLWQPPHVTQDISTALLRCRLREGYLITSAHHGIVTMAIQLGVKQEHGSGVGSSDNSHAGGGVVQPLLLQYVIFPYEHAKGRQARTELWVEPQCGRVCECPPGLEYLNNLSHTDISTAVHRVDSDVVLEVGSFVHLLHCCQTRQTTLTPGSAGSGEEEEKEEDKEGGGEGSVARACVLDFEMSSLLDKSIVCALLLRAFSDGVGTAGVQPLDRCSDLNRQFWQHLYMLLRALAPTQVPFSKSSQLLQRLCATNKLQQLFSLPGFAESGNSMAWRCSALSHDKTVTILCLPCAFFHSSSLSQFSTSSSARSSVGLDEPVEAAPPSPQPLYLPLLLVQVHQECILEPFPSPISLPVVADSCRQLDLVASLPPLSQVDESHHHQLGEANVQSRVASLHKECYLELLHSALTSQLSLSSQDFLLGLSVCQHMTVTLDMTPLLSALCPHCLTLFPAKPELGSLSFPLQADVLCQLLEATLSKHEWSVCVQARAEGAWPEQGREKGSSECSCSQSTSELNQVFLAQLAQLGFKPVPGCAPGYFWMDSASAPSLTRHGKDRDSGEDKSFIYQHSQSTSNDLSPLHKDTATLKERGKVLEQELGSPMSDSDSSEDDMEFVVGPLVSPSSSGEEEEGGGGTPDPPLFLQVSLSLHNSDRQQLLWQQQQQEEGKGPAHHGPLTTCIKSLLEASGLREVKRLEPGAMDVVESVAKEGVVKGTEGVASYIVSVDLVFSSQCLDSNVEQGQRSSLSVLPRCYQTVVGSLRHYLQWLLCDELVSVGRCLDTVSAPLLQAVAAHVQNSHNSTPNCRVRHVPLKFVFGEIHSLTHFTQQLEALALPGYYLLNTEDYYYLQPKPLLSSSTQQGRLSANLFHSECDLQLDTIRHLRKSSKANAHRSRTPPPPPPLLPSARTHRRSQSSGYPVGHVPPAKSSSLLESLCVSEADLIEVGSGYEAGQSDDNNSCLSEVAGLCTPPSCVGSEGRPWVLVRVLSGSVAIYLQVRSSQVLDDLLMQEVHDMYEQVYKEVQLICHRTNQWFLLKDMLETHVCSPYLLLESASEAWVEGVVQLQGRGDTFRSQEFMCELVHSCHITPHWRVKDMKGQAALLVTRSALSAFAVTNSKDVYVLQDITATGEESVFYVKIDESLCSVGKVSVLEAPPTLERIDTAGTIDESLSTLSYQQSLSELLAETERRGTVSTIDLATPSRHSSQGKPQESLVLQVYGITPASRDFKERLHGTIQRKLEATTLDILCGLYARNQQLKLSPEDVSFLQPDFRRPTLTFHLPLPDWLGQGSRQAFFFYFLQMLSTFTIYPSYFSADTKEHYQLQAHKELQDAYARDGLSSESTSDHLFLYIRPQTKGRGMAVLCVSLADPMGRVIGPLLGRTIPLKFEDRYLAYLEEECVVNEHVLITGSHSIKLHVWEKGNIGIEDFMHRLSVSYRKSMCDYFLEVYLLPSPMTQSLPALDGNRLPDLASEGVEERMEDRSVGVLEQLTPAATVQVQPKKASVMSFGSHASEFSRQNSENLSRRSSENLSRCASENMFRLGPEAASACAAERLCRQGSTDSMFGHGSDNSSRLSSGRGSLSSTRKLSLTYSESRRMSGDECVIGRLGKVSQSLSQWRQDQLGQHFHDQVIDESEEPKHPLDGSISSMTPAGQERVQDGAVKGGSESELACPRKGAERSGLEASTADLAKCRVLSGVYTTTLPIHLNTAKQASCPSVRFLSLPILGHHSARVFVSQAFAALSYVMPEFTFSVFQHNPLGYMHYVPEKDWTQVTVKADKRLQETSFIIIGRHVAQWTYCNQAGPTSSMETAPDSSAAQLFSGLDSKHTPSSSCQRTPLQSAAMAKDVFVPRRRMVFLRVTQHQGEVWLYNVCEQVIKQVSYQLMCVRDWLACRSGLLHHLLAQKMGLFKHCQGPAVREYSKLAFKKCSTIPNVVKLIKSNVPLEEPSAKRLGLSAGHHNYLISTEHVAIDSVYQEQRVYGPIAASQDPVFNHGRQFRDWHTYHRKQLESQDLLGRVFVSWQSWGGGACVPVNSTIIDSLKRMARLLHYCTSPLLIHPHLVSSIRTTTSSATSISAWCEALQMEVLTLYLKYLNSLGFQPINERTASRRKSSSHKSSSSPSTSSRLYKCVQHSWPEGIIMVEVMFQQLNFMVKLYTLERSRLQQGVEFSPSFSRECARYKDFIHVNSFMHDMHLRLLQDLLCKTRIPPYPLDLHQVIAICHTHSSPPPHYVKNLLTKGTVRVPACAEPHLLYRHLITHCKIFGISALERQVGAEVGMDSSHADEEVCLLFDVCSVPLSPSTSPELTNQVQDLQSSYSIKVVALYSRQEPPPDQVHYLELVFYLLLVNREDSFPRLTCLGQRAACHPLPAHMPHMEPDAHESDLHLKVRERRQAMGFGSLATPSAASQLLLEQDKVDQMLRAVQAHLEDTIRRALYHMRKDELWKRMLYGSSFSGMENRDNLSMVLVDLTYSDFCDLLCMVEECPLDLIDPRLELLKKQPCSWFKKLIQPLRMRFSDSIRVYTSPNGSHVCAVIVNPDWHDMFVLIQHNSDTHKHGLSVVYRKALEGGVVPHEERPITAHLEADRLHIETVVNFCCSFLWASILDSTPPPPALHLL